MLFSDLPVANVYIAYSHADRLGGDLSLLSYAHIQDVICKGKDIYDMLPEVCTISISIDSYFD